MMLILENAAFQYADQAVFKDICFSLAQEKWLAVMGESGVGKSSLLRCLAGLHRRLPTRVVKTHGTIQWMGQEGFDVAYMAQEDGLLPWLSVLDNVLLPFHLSSHQINHAEAFSLLKAMKLDDYAKAKPYVLSGGMRQRVALARTLIQQTDLVLMDEPFAALDAMTRLHMQALSFNTLRARKKTVFMVTHDPWEALRLADVIIILKGMPARIAATIHLPSTTSVRDITQPELIARYKELMSFFVPPAEV